MMPEWLSPPLPDYTGPVRTVKQDWGMAERPTKPRKQYATLPKGESKRLLAVLELVRAYPGRRVSELQTYTRENLNWMMRNLKRAGKIRAEGSRGNYTYWPLRVESKGALRCRNRMSYGRHTWLNSDH